MKDTDLYEKMFEIALSSQEEYIQELEDLNRQYEMTIQQMQRVIFSLLVLMKA